MADDSAGTLGNLTAVQWAAAENLTLGMPGSILGEALSGTGGEALPSQKAHERWSVKLRDAFTLERLTETFNLDAGDGD